MQKLPGLKTWLGAITVTLLVGCGGNGGESPAPPEPEEKSGLRPDVMEVSADESKTLKHEMVYIPGGKFTMGTSEEQRRRFVDEYGVTPDIFEIQTGRGVEVAPFYIDKYEVTNRQYRRFVEATGYRPPVGWVDYGYVESMEDCPVTCINYEDALAYARWSGKRLPTEEEWEIAARGLNGRLWPWGNEWKEGACKVDDAGEEPMIALPAPVGSYPSDRSVYGVMDMAGNVTEWVYTPLPPEKMRGLVKGGSFANAEPYNFISAARELQPSPNGFVGYIGFRCAMDAPGGEAQAGEVIISRHIIKDTLTTPASSKIFTVTKSPPAVLAKPDRPDPDLYGSRPIQIFPVAYLPTYRPPTSGIAQVYIPYSIKKEEALKKIVPWRIEINVPYLPGDRFGLLFEYLFTRVELKKANFNDDFTSALLTYFTPDFLEVTVSLRGGLDYVDLEYDIKNIGTRGISAHQVCFQALQAPNFRDHDGIRTFIMTDQGWKRRIELWHHVDERMWLQFYNIGEKPPESKSGPIIKGPFIATVSRDHKWVISPITLSAPTVMLFNNREYSCLHNEPNSNMKPDEQMTIKQRIYFLKGGLEDLISRYELDLTAHK